MTKGYVEHQDLEDYAAGAVPQEIEMASVSVVPDDTFTVTQAVNALGFGWFQVKLSLWTGLCWMADSMEMTILSILSPALHCSWKLTKYQQALTTAVVFLGMMLSSTFWGNLSDRYGRKHVNVQSDFSGKTRIKAPLTFLGFELVRRLTFLLRPAELAGAQLHVDPAAARPGGLRHRLHPAKCHPLRRVLAYQAKGQVRGAAGLFLGAGRLLRGRPGLGGDARPRVAMAAGPVHRPSDRLRPRLSVAARVGALPRGQRPAGQSARHLGENRQGQRQADAAGPPGRRRRRRYVAPRALPRPARPLAAAHLAAAVVHLVLVRLLLLRSGTDDHGTVRNVVLCGELRGRLQTTTNERLRRSVVDHLGRVSRHLLHRHRHRAFRAQKNDGGAVRRLRHLLRAVGVVPDALAFDVDVVHGARHHRRRFPSRLRLHAGSLPDDVALGGRGRLQRHGASRRHGHSLRRAGASAHFRDRGHLHLRGGGAAGGRGLPDFAHRNFRQRAAGTNRRTTTSPPRIATLMTNN